MKDFRIDWTSLDQLMNQMTNAESQSLVLHVINNPEFLEDTDKIGLDYTDGVLLGSVIHLDIFSEMGRTFRHPAFRNKERYSSVLDILERSGVIFRTSRFMNDYYVFNPYIAYLGGELQHALAKKNWKEKKLKVF